MFWWLDYSNFCNVNVSYSTLIKIDFQKICPYTYQHTYSFCVPKVFHGPRSAMKLENWCFVKVIPGFFDPPTFGYNLANCDGNNSQQSFSTSDKINLPVHKLLLAQLRRITIPSYNGLKLEGGEEVKEVLSLRPLFLLFLPTSLLYHLKTI